MSPPPPPVLKLPVVSLSAAPRLYLGAAMPNATAEWGAPVPARRQGGLRGTLAQLYAYDAALSLQEMRCLDHDDIA